MILFSLLSYYYFHFIQTRFQAAADSAKLFTKKPSDEELLKLYSLFKQGTIGDCNTPQPGFFEFVNKAKWNAWNAHKGKTKEQAMEEYIAFVADLATKL